MKRIYITIILLCLFLNAGAGYISACTFQLTPASFSVKPEGEVDFHLERTRTSDQCPDSPTAATISVTGGDLSDPGSWKTGDTDSLDFRAKFNGTSLPEVNVTFDCNVTGLVTTQVKGMLPSLNIPTKTSSDLKDLKIVSAASTQKNATPSPLLNPRESGPGTVNPENPIKSTNNDGDKSERLFTQIAIIWSASPPGLRLWYLFILTGLLFYFLKLKQLRKPLLFLNIIVLGFLMNDFANPNPVLFRIFTEKINYHTILPFLLIPVIISLLFGRFFCGWACPVGAIQEFLSPDEKKRILPAPVDRVLKYFKYILFLWLIFYLVKDHRELWSAYDPFKTLFSFRGTIPSIIFLVLVLFVSVLIERPFCRYICPMGAILSITSRFSFIKMRADANKCMVCGRCTAGDCSMDAISAFNPVVDLPAVDSAECIYCFRCQKQCRKKALQVTAFRIDHISSSVGKSEER